MVCIEIILQSKMKEKPNAHRNVIYSAFGCEMTVYNFNAVGLRGYIIYLKSNIIFAIFNQNLSLKP